jgi:hypothetical protein
MRGLALAVLATVLLISPTMENVSENFFYHFGYTLPVSGGVTRKTQMALGDRDLRYEAVVRFRDGSTQHVQVRAQDFYSARDMMRAMYCQGRDCIVEGPWVAR